MTQKELDSFDTFADFRYSQTAYIKSLAEDLSPDVTAKEIARAIERAAAFQEMRSETRRAAEPWKQRCENVPKPRETQIKRTAFSLFKSKEIPV